MDLAAFQASGEYDAAIRDWEAKPVADKTFKNFRPFIQREFTKRVKHDKTSAQSVGKGIANQAREDNDTPSEADQAAWALAEVASVMQAAQDKQMEKLMELFTKSMEAMKNSSSPAPAPAPAPGPCRQRAGRSAAAGPASAGPARNRWPRGSCARPRSSTGRGCR